MVPLLPQPSLGGLSVGLDKLGLGPIVIRHDGHVGVLENGRLTCMTAPIDQKLCFDAHAADAAASLEAAAGVAVDEKQLHDCCNAETAHVCLIKHPCQTPDVCLAPHFHAAEVHGEISQDATVQCKEMMGCALPMSVAQSGVCGVQIAIDGEHSHFDGCGHERVPHGDHFDFLLPLDDGSFLLRHHHEDDSGGFHIDDHGRLVKAEMQAAHENHTPERSPTREGVGLRRRGKKLLDIFHYESPGNGYYTGLPQAEMEHSEFPLPQIRVSPRPDPSRTPTNRPKGGNGVGLELPALVPAIKDEQVLNLGAIGKGSEALEKTVLDVLGICCPSEVPLIKKILEPLAGVVEVTCNVPAKTTTVLHDPTLTTDLQLVNALNEARLEASLHKRGQVHKARLPGWNVWICGLLLAIAIFQSLFGPLKYVALGAIAIGLPPILLKGLASLRRCVLDINSLMTIATGGAIAIGDYTEGAAIVFLFSVAEWLETRSSDKARQAIAGVMTLAPETAVLADSGLQVRTEDVKIGTLLAVRQGQLIPIDGVVDGGSSTVDESSLTGESVPVRKEAGQDVWAGTVNLGGFLRVKTTALAADSATSRMIRLVEEAQGQRSQSERFVEKFAKFYTPVVVLAAILLAVIPYAAGIDNARDWFYLALVLLVVACPCALVIATPMVSVCGIAQGARTGMLIKGGAHLETLGRLKVLAMDKTGTLTEGHFRVAQLLPVSATADIKHTLSLLAAVEAQSSHPMAAALVAYARLRGADDLPAEVTDFEVLPGEGVQGTIGGRTVYIGNGRMAERLGWQHAVDGSVVDLWASEGGTVGWIGVEKDPLAVFSVADQPRQEASAAVRDLQRAGLRVVMLTGDNKGAAMAVRDQVDKHMEVHAGLLPEDKVRQVAALKANGAVVGMVGDGINDAPALAAADLGIAMGVAGTAVAMETADCSLMTNDLRQLARAVRLGRTCRRIVQQNVAFSLLTKVVVIVLSVLGYSGLWLAVVADVGTSLAVIFNSMRVLSRDGRRQSGSSKACVAAQFAAGDGACSEKVCCVKPGSEGTGSCEKDSKVESKSCGSERECSKGEKKVGKECKETEGCCRKEVKESCCGDVEEAKHVHGGCFRLHKHEHKGHKHGGHDHKHGSGHKHHNHSNKW